MSAKVLIIGGGIIGLSIARELHRNGAREITILERGKCGAEASWAAAGMLSPQAEADLVDPFFNFCCKSRDLYVEFADTLLEETGIDIELDRTGTLHLAFSDKEESALRIRLAWQLEAGLAVEVLAPTEAVSLEPNLARCLRLALRFPLDWQVENRQVLAALLRYCRRNELDIVEDTAVEGIVVEHERAVGARTASTTYRADTTVLATGAWTSLIELGAAPTPVDVKPIRGQIVSFRPDRRLFRHTLYGAGGYLVPRRSGRILAGSTTEDSGFDKSITLRAAEDLKAMARHVCPALSAVSISDQWAGLRPFATDGLPVIGSISGVENLFVATAHYRNGVLLAPLTARLAAGKIIYSRDDPVFSIFAPDRFLPSVGSASA